MPLNTPISNREFLEIETHISGNLDKEADCLPYDIKPVKDDSGNITGIKVIVPTGITPDQMEKITDIGKTAVGDVKGISKDDDPQLQGVVSVGTQPARQIGSSGRTP